MTIKLKLFVILCAAVTLAGCIKPHKRISPYEVRAQNAYHVMKLKHGMTREEMLELMGNDWVKTQDLVYKEFYSPEEQFMSDTVTYLEIRNPHKLQVIKRDRSLIEIYFYYTRINSDDLEHISDDELMPIVLKNGVVTGWGWPYYNENIDLLSK